MSQPAFTVGTVECDYCGEIHVAELHHITDTGTYFEVTCTRDYLADYYDISRVTPKGN